MAPGRPDDAEAPGLLSEDGDRAPLARGAAMARGRRAATGGGVLLGCAALLGVAAWRTAAPAQVAKLSAGDVSDAISAFKVGGGFFRPGPRGPRVDAKLISARTQYSEIAAEAFAALAKTAYCGPLPGLSSSVALTCSALQLPVANSSCERASFEVVPGFVRAFQASDLYQPDAIFGYIARVQPTSGAGPSPVEPGVVIAVRGAIVNGASSKWDKEVAMKRLENCDGCSVHEGFHEEYRKIEAQLDMYLTELNCRAADCKLYVTGHGSGADVAALAAWELAQRNYSVGTSYLFSSSMVGNDVFARRMSQLFEGGAHGPIFRVTSGKDSSARWPFDAAFKQWGIQAHYASHADENVTEICYADDGACGVNALKQHELNFQDTCKSAKAPDGDFCVMNHFGGQCYGGLSFKVLDQMTAAEEAWLKEHGIAAAVPELPPDEQAARAWHPAEADGKQAEAIAKEMRSLKPEHLHSLEARASARAAASTQAACIASVLAGRPRAEVVAQARARFRCMSLADMDFDTFMDNKPNPKLYSLSAHASLGDCDAFVSHSWHDDPEAKWIALQEWRESFKSWHGREPNIWFDKVCIDQLNIDEDLGCLPIFLSGCQRLVILGGSTYLSRLWCILELFVYVQMGGGVGVIEFVPVLRNDKDGSYQDLLSISNAFRDFDASACRCRNEQDRQRILAVISTAFCGMEEFNRVVREMVINIGLLRETSTLISQFSSEILRPRQGACMLEAPTSTAPWTGLAEGARAASVVTTVSHICRSFEQQVAHAMTR